MITGKITGTPLQIATWAHDQKALATQMAIYAESLVAGCSAKQRIYQYQAAVLYVLAAQYDRPKARILEIGTYYGYSAAVMAHAARLAHIDTLNPTPWEWEADRKNLKDLTNVRCYCVSSQDYLKDYAGPDYDLVFVDGDHKRVREDLPWWGRIKPGGLFLFHDYSPAGSVRQCPPVYRALNDFAAEVGREPDILVVDDQQVGMAGWYKED